MHANGHAQPEDLQASHPCLNTCNGHTASGNCSTEVDSANDVMQAGIGPARQWSTLGGPGKPPKFTVTDIHFKNRFLANLPGEAKERLAPYMRRVLLHQGHTIQERGSEVEHVFFVEKGVVSLVVDSHDGTQVEAAVTGAEGIVNVLAMLDTLPSFQHAVVQIPGSAYKLPVEKLREIGRSSPRVQQTMNRHIQFLMAQASQAALCNRNHTVEERLSRWLLSASDRIRANDLELTHEHIANMLGVRRPAVTICLGIFQQLGMIEIHRAHIRILDREKLAGSACECYPTIRNHFAMLEN